MRPVSMRAILASAAVGTLLAGCATTVGMGPGYYTYDSRLASPKTPPPVVYQEPAVVYREPAVIYREPAVIYREPAVMYREPTVVYRDSAVVYSEPTIVYRSERNPVLFNDHGQ